jgi:phosphoglycolate phosphatase
MTKVVFCDLDGTLLGRGGSLIHAHDGAPNRASSEAAFLLADRGIPLIPTTGRGARSALEDARRLGVHTYICEGGSLLVFNGEEHWIGGYEPRDGRSVFEQIEATGAPELLLGHFGSRLEPHLPYYRQRAAIHNFRGTNVDLGEANALLAELTTRQGVPPLVLVSNGAVPERMADPSIDRHDPVLSYHLRPTGAGKAEAVASCLGLLGRSPDEAIAIGDSHADFEMHRAVGTVYVVCNALVADPGLAALIAQTPNAVLVEQAGPEGVLEVVETVLGIRRPG